MRPTNLGFRSPKERTAEYSNPNVTYDGRLLPFIQPKHSTMPLSKRFMQYEVAARRTAGRVGPGSYNIRKGSIDQNDVPGTPVIRPYHALKNLTSNGYFFIGDQVVYDPSFDKKERKSSQPSMEIKTSRFSSASNHRDTSVRHQDSLEKMKNSPYLAHRKKNQELST
jgi:hypothetical protein